MAALAVTEGSGSITTTSARLDGSWSVAGACCGPPCCDIAQRFYYGTTSPPGTILSAGTFCSDTPSDCSGGQDYSATLSGRTADTTYYFRASVVISGCGGGTCSGQSNGAIDSFKTLAAAMTITALTSAPGSTTVQLGCTFNPNTHESVASLKVQYKLATEPTIWTDGATHSGLSGTSGVVHSFTVSGLSAGTNYNYRFVATRNAQNANSLTSSTGNFTTTGAAQTTTGSETATPTDSFTATITGPAKAFDEPVHVGFAEQVTLEIRSTQGEKLTGVWFYHFPTQSYWFWTLSGFSAALTSSDGRGNAKTWIALGSDVFLIDDEDYAFDDRDQNFPIDTDGEFEAPLSITMKGVDFKGRYAAPSSLDVKLGAFKAVDPLGHVRIEVTADQYQGGPLNRRLLQSRTVDMAKHKAGVDEWRRYSLGRVRAVQVVTPRLTFPRRQHPRRTNRIVIAAVRLVSRLTSLIRGRI